MLTNIPSAENHVEHNFYDHISMSNTSSKIHYYRKSKTPATHESRFVTLKHGETMIGQWTSESTFCFILN